MYDTSTLCPKLGITRAEEEGRFSLGGSVGGVGGVGGTGPKVLYMHRY